MDQSVAQRIAIGVRKLAEGAAVDVKKLSGQRNSWRLRVGDWRVLFEEGEAEIVIAAVVHRSRAYRKN